MPSVCKSSRPASLGLRATSPAFAANSAARPRPVRQNERLNTPLSSSISTSLASSRFQSFDLLATLVAVVRSDGTVLFANSALEDALGSSRRTIEGSVLPDSFTEPQALHRALEGAGGNQFAALRYDAWLKRLNHEPFPVHVIVTQTDMPDEIVVELLPLELQARQEREERLVDQAQANKELIRNLAHEIKNPLGGIRGAAQLLEMEVESRDLKEYTQVIIHEADRLQTLVDRLLAPHRRPHLVGDVNIHEVCERVRALIVAEFPKGLKVVRDYDTSIPEFRGDREQLIQTVLNVAHNACQALVERITLGDACLTFRTRIARQITFGKQRYKLALELHVMDNGPGIPDSIKDRIFYPLVSGREGGSGLGLTLAQTFVQQHHGLIEVESVPGRTDFTILIPLP
ncbi:nitrogen regulation protein NR(II) [Rhodoferax sp.]|uniref:nitrogen regulation protein NR(II) n=1 Tax=Rhodoferax sp. TaxID=50421 RepID=UPI0039B82401